MTRHPGISRTVFPAAALAAALVLAPGAASADFIITMGGTYNGDSPSGSAPYLRATFRNTATPGTVRLTLENLMTASGGQQFVDTWLFNVAPTITSGITFNYVSGVKTATASGTPEFSPNAYGNNQGPGVSGMPKSGLFDIVFSFATSNSGNPPRFSGAAGSNTSVWDIVGPSSLTETSFNFLSVKDGSSDNQFASAAHVQGIPQGGGTTSGALYSTSTSTVPVPEPASATLSGTGFLLAALAGLRWRWRLLKQKLAGEPTAAPASSPAFVSVQLTGAAGGGPREARVFVADPRRARA